MRSWINRYPEVVLSAIVVVLSVVAVFTTVRLTSAQNSANIKDLDTRFVVHCLEDQKRQIAVAVFMEGIHKDIGYIQRDIAEIAKRNRMNDGL